MFIIKLIRRLRGFVRFSLTGGFPERFFTLAARDGIHLRDLHKNGKSICAYVNARDYKRLRRHARDCGCRMRLEKKYGLPFFLRKNRRRKGLLTGALAALLLLAFLSRSVWIVSVSGETSLSEGEILYALRNNGLYPGVPKKGINLLAAEQQSIIDLPSVSWLAVNLKGCRAYVEVSERTEPPELLPLSSPCNIVASDSGTVQRISAFCGEAAVSAGDSVVKGDLLVSGIDSAELPVHAIAEVIAHVPVKIEVFVPYRSVEKQYTGKTVKKSVLHFLNLNIPLSFFEKMSYNKYDTVVSTDFLHFFGGSLPIGKTVTEYLEYESAERLLSPEDASQKALTEARSRAKNAKRASSVISESESVTLLPDGALCTLELLLEKDIAEEREIFID